ncbi:MAG: DUF5333 domain-containing protein [Rhodobacteraceae bacterium]|nr:DUF5333 domain-containing protein [Paracoccaceae bacterium]
MRLMLSTVLATVLSAGVTSAAQALPPLSEQVEINQGLTAITIADMIRHNCKSIDARLLRAFGYMRTLKQMATDAGYSDDEIEAFVTDKAEKARVKDAARAWLVAHGVVLDDGQSYCPVGLAEIEGKTAIGVLLRAD